MSIYVNYQHTYLFIFYTDYSLKIIPNSHKYKYSHDDDQDLYQFENITEEDALVIKLKVGELFIAPQRLIHAGGGSNDACVTVFNELYKLTYTHVSIHVDFCLVESFHEVAPKIDSTFFVNFK